MTKEEKKTVEDFCKNYIPTRCNLVQAQKDKAMLERKLATDITHYERVLIENEIARKDRVIAEERSALLLLEVAMTELYGIDRAVFQQLYIEGKQQGEVVNEEGELIGDRRVRRLRDRSIEIVGPFLLERIPMLTDI